MFNLRDAKLESVFPRSANIGVGRRADDFRFTLHHHFVTSRLQSSAAGESPNCSFNRGINGDAAFGRPNRGCFCLTAAVFRSPTRPSKPLVSLIHVSHAFFVTHLEAIVACGRELRAHNIIPPIHIRYESCCIGWVYANKIGSSVFPTHVKVDLHTSSAGKISGGCFTDTFCGLGTWGN